MLMETTIANAAENNISLINVSIPLLAASEGLILTIRIRLNIKTHKQIITKKTARSEDKKMTKFAYLVTET